MYVCTALDILLALMTSEPNIPTSINPPTPSIAEDLKNLNNQIRAKIVSDALKKGGIGALTGAAFSFLIFRSKYPPFYSR